MSGQNFRSYLVIGVFLGIIIFPMLNHEFKLVKDIPGTENRQMASKPELDINSLDAYPGKFEKYYNDHFFIRTTLVKYYNRMSIVLLKKSLLQEVILGNDGWLFGAGAELDACRGVNPIEPDKLEAIRHELEYRKKYIEKLGAKFYFLIAPTKTSIYSEMIPYNDLMKGNKSWGEQMNQYLYRNSEVKPVDVFDILRRQKKSGFLYSKLDMHMTELGAFYTANEVLKRIHADMAEVSPAGIENFSIRKTTSHGGNLAAMFGNDDLFMDHSYALSPLSGFKSREVAKSGYTAIVGFAYPWDYEKVRETEQSDKPSILVISDSFGEDIFPFLAEEFSRSVKIFDAWQYKLNEEILLKEKPDVVLLIVWEPHLKLILDYGSGPE